MEFTAGGARVQAGIRGLSPYTKETWFPVLWPWEEQISGEEWEMAAQNRLEEGEAGDGVGGLLWLGREGVGDILIIHSW